MGFENVSVSLASRRSLPQVLGLNSATFVAIGLVAVLAGDTNTPTAASIISVALFGPAVAPYAAIACVVS